MRFYSWLELSYGGEDSNYENPAFSWPTRSAELSKFSETSLYICLSFAFRVHLQRGSCIEVGWIGLLLCQVQYALSRPLRTR